MTSDLITETDPETGLIEADEQKFDVVYQFRKLWKGDSGVIPVVIGLIALVLYFQFRDHNFLTAQNLVNLMDNATIYVMLGMAEIWLLLLGEIDLSVGVTCALSGLVATILTDNQFHWPWFLALPLAVLVSMGISLVYGLFVIRLRVASVVVTLGGWLIVQGVLIGLVDAQGTGGSVQVNGGVLYDLVQGGTFTPVATWISIVVGVVLTSAYLWLSNQRRLKNGLVAQPRALVLMKIVTLLIVGAGLVWVFNTNRSNFLTLEGMPFAIPIVIGVYAIGLFILTKTRPGRYVYAIGGNAEAARRAGIPVNRYRLMAFVLTGFTVGMAGLLDASNLGGISDAVDPTLTLYAVAAAVIGGTSLMGGRGKMLHAIIGGLVIGVIYDGMSLLRVASNMLYVVTGIVLVAAVTLDSVARRGSTIVK